MLIRSLNDQPYVSHMHTHRHRSSSGVFVYYNYQTLKYPPRPNRRQYCLRSQILYIQHECNPRLLRENRSGSGIRSKVVATAASKPRHTYTHSTNNSHSQSHTGSIRPVPQLTSHVTSAHLVIMLSAHIFACRVSLS